jgi:PBSX family phage terminase large subunit
MSGKGEVQLWGRTIDIVGANDERAEAKIRGSEYVGALLDEVTILPENFVKMLFSRLSLSGAKLFGSTNPDSPFHWLKVEFLDKAHERDIAVFSFSIDDNPSLDEDYKKNLKKEYSGLWYQRYIEGRWVLAEGAIYDFFEEDRHTLLMPPGPADYYIVGIDYGTSNPCVYSLIGYNAGLYPNIWLEKEYYYDSKAKNRQKSDSEYAKDLVDFISGYPVKAIYIDPSALSFKVEMRRLGLNDVLDAKNDVIPGIRFQGQLLSNGTYKVCRTCINTIKEYSTYLWDEKASKRGIDQPLKQNDHCCDAQRYALYTHFFDRLQGGMTEADAIAMERTYGKGFSGRYQNNSKRRYI